MNVYVHIALDNVTHDNVRQLLQPESPRVNNTQGLRIHAGEVISADQPPLLPVCVHVGVQLAHQVRGPLRVLPVCVWFQLRMIVGLQLTNDLSEKSLCTALQFITP